MIDEKEIEEAAKSWCEEVKCLEPIDGFLADGRLDPEPLWVPNQYGLEGFSQGALWVIEKLKERSGKSFGEWWDGYIHADTFTQTASETWQAAAITYEVRYSEEKKALETRISKLREALESYDFGPGTFGHDTLKNDDLAGGGE